MLKLFEKKCIGNLKLRNRIIMGPMGTTGEADGAYTMNNIHYFAERAKGGAAMLITGANVVSTKYEDRPCTELSNFHHVERLAMLVERCHHYGAKICVQISPGLGRMVFTDPFTPPYSASECQSFWFQNLRCKPLPVEGIKHLVERLGYSASLAVAAGADAVELHAYGGYLLDQFHSKIWNIRTDEYGGDLRGRMKFTLEAIASIQTAVGPGFPIIVKFTPYHGVPGGRELEEGLEMAKILEESGVDALHVDVGCYEAWYKAITTVYSEPGHQADIFAAVKKAISLPVLGQGKLKDPALAEKVLADGKCDFVVLAHQLLADPHWPNKVKNGYLYDVTPCLGCNECLFAGFSGKHYYCSVNPLCFAEADYPLTPAVEQKSVLVVGGGPGGMEAAIAAAERGFNVDLWEKSDRLGGQLWAAGAPSFKADVLLLIQYMENKLYRSGVSVRLMKEATAQDILRGGYDKVILATGSKPIVLPVAGVENAVESTDILLGKVKTGDQAVVIGGGLVGCETALWLKETASNVTIVELLDDILLTAAHSLNNLQHLRALLTERKVAVVVGAKVTEITPDKVIYEKDGEVYAIAADTVVIAAGYSANNELAGELEDQVDLTVVGDAAAPRKILSAVHEAYHAIRIME